MIKHYWIINLDPKRNLYCGHYYFSSSIPYHKAFSIATFSTRESARLAMKSIYIKKYWKNARVERAKITIEKDPNWTR